MFLCKLTCMPRAPDAHLAKLPNDSQRLQVALRLHSPAEDGQHFHLATGEEICRYRGNRRGPHLGDQASVHRDERLAGFGSKKENHGVVSRNPLVVRIKGHQLGPERAVIGGHNAEEASVLVHGQHLPQRLHHFARRKIAQRIRHRGNQFLHPQVRTDVFFVQKHLVRRLQIDQLAKFFQIDIAAGNDANDRTLSRFPGERRGQRHRARPFRDDARFLRHQPHAPSAYLPG